jgi:hypothetical protein
MLRVPSHSVACFLVARAHSPIGVHIEHRTPIVLFHHEARDDLPVYTQISNQLVALEGAMRNGGTVKER